MTLFCDRFEVSLFPVVPDASWMPTSPAPVTLLLLALIAPGAVELTSIPEQEGVVIVLRDTVMAAAVSRTAMALQLELVILFCVSWSFVDGPPMRIDEPVFAAESVILLPTTVELLTAVPGAQPRLAAQPRKMSVFCA